MTIHIEELRFQAIIGILDFERVTPQDIIINLNIEYNYKNDFINYAHVVTILQRDMIESQFELIEDALSHFSTKLKSEFPTIEKLHLKITKPSIIPECIVSVSNSYSF